MRFAGLGIGGGIVVDDMQGEQVGAQQAGAISIPLQSVYDISSRSQTPSGEAQNLALAERCAGNTSASIGCSTIPTRTSALTLDVHELAQQQAYTSETPGSTPRSAASSVLGGGKC